MVKRYTDEQMNEFAAFYEEHGAVKLPGLVEPEWVEKIHHQIELARAKADAPSAPGQGLSFGSAPGRMTIRHQWRENPVVREFLLRPELAEPIARVVGAETLRFWFDLTFIHDGSPDPESDGKGAGTGWHHDLAAFQFQGMQLPSLWMAMTPCDADRSRLMFIDKSHKTSPGFYRTPPVPNADGKFPPRPTDDGLLDCPDFDALVAEGKETILTWDCEPGDALMIHPMTIHGASGNTGDKGGRIAITTRWFGDDVRFLPFGRPGYNQVPGVAENPIPLGGRPKGEYFPQVWPEVSFS